MRTDSFRDRLASLSRGELVGLAVVAAVTLAGAGVWYVRSLPRPVEIRAPSQGPRASSLASPSPATVVVHVAGWVRDPGVYELPEGDRVIDALRAAGGPRRGADLQALNLAAPLADGVQILVPRRSAGGTTPAGPSQAGGAININTASAAELEALPGIGPVLAQAIVDYRTENGPFTSVDELEEVSGIGPATLEEVRDLVTV